MCFHKKREGFRLKTWSFSKLSIVKPLKLNEEYKFCSHRFVLVQVQLATLTQTKHTYMWVKNKNTTSCMLQNASTEYKSARNKAK
jgi:hypothetical protein